jgi:hypothetical protein
MNNMDHLAHFLSLNKPNTQQRCQLELNLKCLHDLHKSISNEYHYMQKMIISVAHSGFWGFYNSIEKNPIWNDIIN